MINQLAEIQITPIKPQNGLVALASFILDNNLYLGSIGVFTRPEGGYRLTYPTKKVGGRNINIFHPINKQFASKIETVIIKKYEEVMNQQNDRHNQINTR
jgi:DNA-binding cell septation regulator SpoVG